MPPGTYGTVRAVELDNGGWEARTRYRDHTGHTRQVRATARTKTAAVNTLKSRIRDRTEAAGGGTLTADSRVNSLITQWLTSLEGDTRLSDGTKRLYRQQTEGNVRPAVGQLRIREATTPAVNTCLSAINQHSGHGAAKTCRTILNALFRLAVAHGAIDRNPVREANRLHRPERAKKAKALTIEQTDELVDLLRASPAATAYDLPDLVEWMLYTGCRIGEALAAREEVLDAEGGTWEVNATLIRVRGAGLRIQPRTKTEAGWRRLALPPGAVSMLARRKTELRLTQPHGVVFGSPTRRTLRDPSDASGDLKKVLTHIGCPDCGGTGRAGDGQCTIVGPYAWVTSHAFRKTVATRLDEAGLTARQIADHLGHSHPSMTMDVYMGRDVVLTDAARILDR
jgi:integrase